MPPYIGKLMSVHDGQKPFKCNICDYSCSQKKYLTVHIASVHDGKNFVTSNLHIFVHSTEKPFQCDMCDIDSF